MLVFHFSNWGREEYLVGHDLLDGNAEAGHAGRESVYVVFEHVFVVFGIEKQDQIQNYSEGGRHERVNGNEFADFKDSPERLKESAIQKHHH